MIKFDVKPLSSKFGAEVLGLNLNAINQSTIDALYEVIYQYQLVVIRNQNLTPEQQIDACAKFGEIEPHPSDFVPWGHRELTYVCNTDLERKLVLPHSGPSFELWHSDTCYLPNPSKISLLYAECVPTHGGETLFANTVAAYNDLAPEFKTRLDTMKAVFGSGDKLMERCHKLGYKINIPQNEQQPNVVHPVIRTHPVTQNKSIFVNWAHTDCILDIPETESLEILNYLHAHCRQDKYVYTHFPLNGDLMIWDNASLIHSNTDKPLSDIRIMRRVMIKGDKPR